MFPILLEFFLRRSKVDKLTWCAKQNKGIELTDPKPHLSASYMQEADETLHNVITSTGKWKIITAYYACYHAIYSILMKSGIKCEIHDCTIEIMRLFDFSEEEINHMKDLKEKRIQTQYYLKNIELEDINAIKRFVSKCKLLLNELNSDKITSIREQINKIIEKSLK